MKIWVRPNVRGGGIYTANKIPGSPCYTVNRLTQDTESPTGYWVSATEIIRATSTEAAIDAVTI